MGYFDEAKSKRELAHHGILGQKWGVRRFQDYNGKRIGASKTTKKTTTKKKHEFKDKSKSISMRKDAVDAFVTSVVTTAALTPVNAITISSGFIIPHAIAAQAISTIAIGVTGYKLAKGDIDTAVANKKEKKFKEERDKAPVDKKTGFHKKTKEMTPEEDMERVNPGFKNWDENTKNNCVLCTMSYELRRRGYDVQAKKATSGYNGNELVKDWYPGAKPKQSKGSLTQDDLTELWKKGAPLSIDKASQKEMISNTMDEIRSQKDGARGQLCVRWDGATSGHSIAYANEGGKVVIYDTQANKRYEDKAVEKYLKQTSQVTVTRLDNCKINEKLIKEVAE